MNSVLVTGADGFIGRALCRRLEEQGERVIKLTRAQGDVGDEATFRDLEPVTQVFHLAGNTFVPDSWRDPLGFQRTNVGGTTNVLEYCHRHQARLTYVSAYVYGIPDCLPITEETVARPNNPYALSKLMAEQVCAFYSEHRGVAVTVIRPFNIFGPGQKRHFLIPEIVDQVRRGVEVRVKDLRPRRDYTYVDDLVDAFLLCRTGPQGFRLYNIASGRSVSVAEIIAEVQAVAGTSLPVVSEMQARFNEIDDVYAVTARAAKELGWVPAHSFRAGIAKLLGSGSPEV